MKRYLSVLVLLVVATGSAVALAAGQGSVHIQNGIWVDQNGTPVPEKQARLRATQESMISGGQIADMAGHIDFTMTPCDISETVPLLQTFYKRFNIKFKGPSDTDGGAVIDECSNFGVTGYSQPSFMAFNCSATLANGGSPIWPEKIIFSPTVSSASLKIGSLGDAGKHVRVTAKAKSGKTLAITIVTLSPTMTQVNLSGSKRIKKLIIDVPQGESTCIFAVDDIVFTP